MRPVAGWVAMLGCSAPRRERLALAFFGVRGVGSFYYLAYATNQGAFSEESELWATVGFTVLLSVVVHGITATPVMAWLDRESGDPDRAPDLEQGPEGEEPPADEPDADAAKEPGRSGESHVDTPGEPEPQVSR